MKKLIYFLCLMPFVALGQTTTQNYIKTLIYKDYAQTSDDTKAQASVVYFDGLGRPIQHIAGKMSNSGTDINTPIEYDAYGRETREYLPYPVTTTNLAYDALGPANAVVYYKTPSTTVIDTAANPFSEKFLEASPLSRVLKQGDPGRFWKGHTGANNDDHTVKFAYMYNVAEDQVKMLKATATWNNTNLIYSDVSFLNGGSYTAGTLFKIITQDENKTGSIYTGTTVTLKVNTTEEFKNKQGQVVLKRTFDGSSTPLDTYYVYDQYGNLAFVLPPLCTGSNTYIDNLGYQYKYDSRNRLVEKKLPGKQWEYIVYDTLDRPVATGPAITPFGGNVTTAGNQGWMVTKYDAFGRVAYTGWYAATTFSSAARQSMQSSTFSVVTKTATPTTIDNIGVNYTNSFPAAMKVLTINYYDDYIFVNAPTAFTAVEGQNVATNVKGLPTGTWTRVLTTATDTNGELSYTLYDSKGRPVRTNSANYLGGYNQVDTNLDFDATPIYTITRHKRLAADTELVVREDFSYDAQDRLVSHTHKINSLVTQTLVSNEYNALGQAITKNVGGTGVIGTLCQTINYKYNIRGWFTDINDITDLPGNGDLFAFKINYNTIGDNISGNISPLYNGNISETQWVSAADNFVRKYSYKYDKLDRLTNAFYQKPGQDVVLTNSYNENVFYDRNGNITSLNRNGAVDDPNTVVMIDALAYTYLPNSNRLSNVYDSSLSTQGFKDYEDSLHQDYSYDDNGNLLTDKNKGITAAITYNHLNLPVVISFGGANKITYLYNAAGVKLNKTVTEVQEGTNVTMVVDYLGGFQYKAGAIQFFPTSEGYVDCTKVGTSTTYSYVYQYKDHLGNVRMNYTWKAAKGSIPGGAVIKEETHYYPFGLRHINYNMLYLEFQDIEGELVLYPPVTTTGKLAYNYKFGGKEFQEELGFQSYDFGARNYDPALGRWMNIDPKAETSRRWTPYNYAYNNPVYFTDPDGMKAEGCDTCDKLIGAAAAFIDNGTGGLLPVRQFASNFVTNAKAFNRGQDIGDIASILGGGAEVIGGGTMGTGGTVVTVASGGLLAEGAVPVAITGEVIAMHGAMMAGTGAGSYASKKGRINESTGNSGKSGNGRGSNNRTPDPEAVGDHTVVNSRGSTTYKVNPNNPNKNNKGVGFETQKRVDRTGAAHVDKKTGVSTPTPHVQENGKVRRAEPGVDMPN